MISTQLTRRSLASSLLSVALLSSVALGAEECESANSVTFKHCGDVASGSDPASRKCTIACSQGHHKMSASRGTAVPDASWTDPENTDTTTRKYKYVWTASGDMTGAKMTFTCPQPPGTWNLWQKKTVKWQ